MIELDLLLHFYRIVVQDSEVIPEGQLLGKSVIGFHLIGFLRDLFPQRAIRDVAEQKKERSQHSAQFLKDLKQAIFVAVVNQAAQDAEGKTFPALIERTTCIGSGQWVSMSCQSMVSLNKISMLR